MIIAAIAWLKANRLAAAVVGIGALIAALLIAWTVAVYVGERRQAKREEAARSEALLKATTLDAGVKEVLAADRQETALKMERMQRDLEKADDAEDDARPSAARRAYLCGVMRSQARPGAKLPAGC